MKEKITFIKELIKNIKQIGAILPSSKYLSNKMIECVDFSNPINIIEYGPGTGVFTKLISKRINKESKLIIIENNKIFFDILYEKYKSKRNITILFDSVENIESIVESNNLKNIDYIISGIPFTSLPKSLRINIIENTKKVMNKKTIFITFQYTKKLKKFFNQNFKIQIIKKVLRNIPPALIFEMKKY